MTKIWRKPLHKRKVPFVLHLIDTWLQPLPFPTLFKIVCSSFLILLMLLPVIFPIIIIISYYAIFQCLIESTLGIVYPRKLDIVHKTFALFSPEMENENYIEYLNLYFERWRYITTISVSCIDYMRLALAVITN